MDDPLTSLALSSHQRQNSNRKTVRKAAHRAKYRATPRRQAVQELHQKMICCLKYEGEGEQC
jgi:hypothetical protein